jgi:hypothetical protein
MQKQRTMATSLILTMPGLDEHFLARSPDKHYRMNTCFQQAGFFPSEIIQATFRRQARQN